MGINTGEYYFMQENVLLYRKGTVFDTIKSVFGTRFTTYKYSNSYPIRLHWQHYSPDMNPCDFYLWELYGSCGMREAAHRPY